MSTSLLQLVKNLIDELYKNDAVRITNIQHPLPLNQKNNKISKTVTPANIFDLHQDINGLEIEWEIEKKIADVQGSVRILTLDQVVGDWQGIVYFDFTPDEDRIRNFHPIDFFVDEVCVGVFLNEVDRQDRSLYLCVFGNEPINLNLDIGGYIKMLVASKGFLYWQYAIIEILEGSENFESRYFKEWMPRLFPSFSWQEYVQKYNRLKLHN